MQIEVPDDLYERFRTLVARRTFETTTDEYVQYLIARELERYGQPGYGERDKLTGCNNKSQLDADLTHKLSSLGFNGPSTLHYLCIDIAGLKKHNDAYGFPSGDQVILKVADALREAYPGETVYRVGGDEFVVVLSNGEHQTVKAPDGITLRNCIKSL